jgi:hypothetical protein
VRESAERITGNEVQRSAVRITGKEVRRSAVRNPPGERGSLLKRDQVKAHTAQIEAYICPCVRASEKDRHSDSAAHGHGVRERDRERRGNS